jgi:hypothetical protein
VKCKKARSLICDLVTGTISEEEKRNLDLHLKDCPHCEKELTSLSDLMHSLKGLSLPDPGEEFWRALPLRIEREIASTSQEKALLQWIERKVTEIWLFQPGRAAYAFVSMVIIMLVTVFLIYPRYVVREGEVNRGEKEITVRAYSNTPLHTGEEAIGEEGDDASSRIEELTFNQLNLLYSSLISTALPKREGQELSEERVGGVPLPDISSELNDLDSDELSLLSRKLYSIYPGIQEKGAL